MDNKQTWISVGEVLFLSSVLVGESFFIQLFHRLFPHNSWTIAVTIINLLYWSKYTRSEIQPYTELLL